MMSWSVNEYLVKLLRIRQLIAREQIDYVLVTCQTNFLWLTGGRPYVNQASEKACADLLIGQDKVYLVSNNIESNRLLTEELAGLGIEVACYDWWEEQGFDAIITGIVGGKKLLTDIQLGNRFSRLRWDLLEEEKFRYGQVGEAVANILEVIAFTIEPDMSELAIAEMIKHQAIVAGVNPWITLVAVDERAYQYRHPVPTGNKLKRYAMLCLTGQKYGLFVSTTRLVHFGQLPADLAKRHQAVMAVDAGFIGSTVPGVSVSSIFTSAVQSYQKWGYPEEWKSHHQGGMIGYMSREFRALETTKVEVRAGQAYAWNPTIAGVKSEDTILVCGNQATIVSKCRRFPTTLVEYPGGVVVRPSILVL
ncbi:M24 family metallopeptidase [Anaerosporomusa subterranea]|nr:M24 family metallopeptidase [Anaerosporomusa subterranea]